MYCPDIIRSYQTGFILRRISSIYGRGCDLSDFIGRLHSVKTNVRSLLSSADASRPDITRALIDAKVSRKTHYDTQSPICG